MPQTSFSVLNAQKQEKGGGLRHPGHDEISLRQTAAKRRRGTIPVLVRCRMLSAAPLACRFHGFCTLQNFSHFDELLQQTCFFAEKRKTPDLRFFNLKSGVDFSALAEWPCYSHPRCPPVD
ncbi:hypothetical protein LI291_06875 [Intestinibacillus massiliensis]|jgi:hypothetical protein|nr:hypothetical protein [Intestinibacillus massiliensis]